MHNRHGGLLATPHARRANQAHIWILIQTFNLSQQRLGTCQCTAEAITDANRQACGLFIAFKQIEVVIESGDLKNLCGR